MFKLVTYLLFFALTAQARTSVEYQEVEGLVRSRPEFVHALDGWELAQVGSGNRISYKMSPALAGRHVGSYTFPAHSSDGKKEAQMTFETHTVFYDREGKVVAELLADEWIVGEDIFTATEIREELSGITLVEKEAGRLE